MGLGTVIMITAEQIESTHFVRITQTFFSNLVPSPVQYPYSGTSLVQENFANRISCHKT